MNALLTQHHEAYLLDLARKAIISRLTGSKIVRDAALEEALNYNAATFVTLTKRHQLRGCIGTLEAHQPLAEDVIHNAQLAAFNDPRFLEVAANELADIQIEISVLSESQKIEFNSEQTLLEVLRPEIDGVIIESGMHRATFLPQVWEQLPDKKVFLEHLKRKAGLSEDFNTSKLTVWRYSVTYFKEPGLATNFI